MAALEGWDFSCQSYHTALWLAQILRLQMHCARHSLFMKSTKGCYSKTNGHCSNQNIKETCYCRSQIEQQIDATALAQFIPFWRLGSLRLEDLGSRPQAEELQMYSVHCNLHVKCTPFIAICMFIHARQLNVESSKAQN